MTDWVCKTCGTINEDILDKTLTIDNFRYMIDRVEKEQERRHAYELKGEIPKMFCSTCGEERFQGRIK